MTVVIWPDDTNRVVDVRCVVCRRRISVISATVGLFGPRESQAFACDAHLGRGDSSRFLRAWIDFSLEQDELLYDLSMEGALWLTSSLNDASSVTA